MLTHRQDLDRRSGVLTRVDRYRDSAGRTTRVSSRQFVSMCEPHLAALEVIVEAEDWSGEVAIESLINGAVSNRNVVADEQLAHQHLVALRL